MLALLRPALVLFFVLSLITGLAYPLLTTRVATALFPYQAAGSLVFKDGKAVGSERIGQSFSDPRYFWSRPSATMPMPYNASASGGANLGPLNPALPDAIRSRAAALRAADPGNTAPVPVDLVTRSASGLDPHISVAAAEYQASRVARLRDLPLERVRTLIAEHTEGSAHDILGDQRVNVLLLNLALDSAH
ncbi:Potassium-transporting ATPase C chain [Pseudomonas knackmussii B13]|uniref:Potassium-transporting ATPase KdpC subunit n=1 Tax=Pseudomonas knackmussii (strain DSM 6978 / CCUG 54928 / LMG 23759 / B13) TaxID=1301098 RepID=A0A024HHN7_PSEKB|nr:potassium-transporting ATPase subunit KdpC [Pseudomonas knackmussii]CDF84411.1 Potassium-transporting ATPase C chain [Pseudomonas knackmussii B13]